MTMKNILLLFIFCCCGSFVFSQDENTEKNASTFIMDADVQLSFGIPVNQLKGNMDPGYGLGMSVLFGKSDFPLMAGLDFNFHWHNRVSTDTYIFNGEFDELHDFSTASYSMMGDLVIRGEPKNWTFPVIPFADVFIGFNRFVTWTSISGEDEFENDPNLDNLNTTYREKGDWTRGYGLGLGCKIKVWEGEYADDPTVLIKLRSTYRRGGVADYLVKKDDFQIIDSTREAFEEKRSTTDMVMIQLGVTVYIK